MPLLPHTREKLQSGNIAEVENLLDRWVTEVGDLVESAIDHTGQLRAFKVRLTRIRSGFEAAREEST